MLRPHWILWEQQKQAAEVEIAKPFAQEEELQTKSARLAELDALLNMEHQSSRQNPKRKKSRMPAPLCWLRWKKRLIKWSLSDHSNLTWIRMVMPGDGAP